MNDGFSGSGMLGALGAAMGVIWLISMIMCVIMIISQWKIFKKAGEPGVAAIVPFWHTAVLFKITWGKWYYMFLMLIPIVGMVFMFITYFKLAKVFGQGAGFGIGLIFLSFIFMPMLAFGSAEYVGIDGEIPESEPLSKEDSFTPEYNAFAGNGDLLPDQDQVSTESFTTNNKSSSTGRHWSV